METLHTWHLYFFKGPDDFKSGPVHYIKLARIVSSTHRKISPRNMLAFVWPGIYGPCVAQRLKVTKGECRDAS